MIAGELASRAEAEISAGIRVLDAGLARRLRRHPPAGWWLHPAAWGVSLISGKRRRRIFSDASSWPVAPSELARAYLAANCERRRQSARQRSACRLTLPWFFTGPARGPLALVDIRACFFSIWSQIPPDSQYLPGTRVRVGRESWRDLEDIADSKVARNALVPIAAGGTRKALSDSGSRLVMTPALAPALQPAISDIVGFVAHMAHAHGAMLWRVDGGIMRPDDAEILAAELADRFHLRLEIRACTDSGSLEGPNRYTVGTETRDLAPGRPGFHLGDLATITQRVLAAEKLLALPAGCC